MSDLITSFHSSLDNMLSFISMFFSTFSSLSLSMRFLRYLVNWISLSLLLFSFGFIFSMYFLICLYKRLSEIRFHCYLYYEIYYLYLIVF